MRIDYCKKLQENGTYIEDKSMMVRRFGKVTKACFTCKKELTCTAKKLEDCVPETKDNVACFPDIYDGGYKSKDLSTKSKDLFIKAGFKSLSGEGYIKYVKPLDKWAYLEIRFDIYNKTYKARMCEYSVSGDVLPAIIDLETHKLISSQIEELWVGEQ